MLKKLFPNDGITEIDSSYDMIEKAVKTRFFRNNGGVVLGFRRIFFAAVK